MERKRTTEFDIRLIYCLCFFLPFFIMVGCMICFGVQPFGDHSFIIIDGLHQYMPFFSVLYDKLRSGESLFYTFRTGLGVNFLSLFSYYLSSPFNLLILLFHKNQLNMAVSLLVVIKISLAGLAGGIYFSKKTRHPDLSIVTAACLYALNSYMVGYSWNVNWLDALMIFPIIVMGIERIVEKGDGRLYCIALFYALFCNYYIGFMICIFCVLWFLASSFKNIREFFVKGCIFAFFSLLSGGMAAVLLIPAYLGIKQTSSGSEMALPAHEWLTGFADLLNRQFAMTTPISHDNFDGNINLYFGMAVIFAAFLYLFNKEIRPAEKARKILLLALLYLSFNEKVLNFIWHGFHDQYGIPNRFSFLFGFILIGMLVEVMDHYSAIKNWQVVASSAVCIGLLSLARHFAKEPLEDALYGVAGMLVLCYGTICLFMTISRKYKKWYVWIFLTAAALEICACAIIGFDSIGQIKVSKFFAGTDDMEQAVKDLSDGTFYRSELADAKFVDESTWYPLHAISLFGSTAKDDVVHLMDDLGFYTGCNEYLYKGSNPVTDMMLDVRYLFAHNGDRVNSAFSYKKDYGSFSVYENPVKDLSVGYVASGDLKAWDYDYAYPFDVLNDFGYQGYSVPNVFDTIDIDDPETDACSAVRTNKGEYRFSFEEKKNDNLSFTIPIETAADHLYLFYDGTQVEDVQILVDGTYVTGGDKDAVMLYLGRVEEGSRVEVLMRLKGETEEGYIRLSAATIDQEAFDDLSAAMTSGAFQVTAWSENHMEGKVTTKAGQMVFFSIPYDEGWKIEVDGEPEDAQRIGDALLALELDEGDHTVSMTFIPPGYIAGRNISIFCIAVYVLVCIMYWKRGKRRKQKILDELEFEEAKLLFTADLTMRMDASC